MNARVLYIRDEVSGDYLPTKHWFCGVCRMVKHPLLRGQSAQKVAEDCCLPNFCEQCGNEITGSYCNDCWAAKSRANYLVKLEAATEEVEYNGWVWTPEVSGSNDGFFPNVDDLLESCFESECLDHPEFAFCCFPRAFAIDLDGVLENVDENLGAEDSLIDQVNGLPELQAAVSQFNTLNKSVVVYEPDMDRKVRILTKAEVNGVA